MRPDKSKYYHINYHHSCPRWDDEAETREMDCGDYGLQRHRNCRNPLVSVNHTTSHHPQRIAQTICQEHTQRPDHCDIDITVRNKDNKKSLEFTETVYKFIEKQINKLNYPVALLGPAQSYISKLNGTYRWQIILKGDRKHLKEILEQTSSSLRLPSETFINIELDPSDLL